MNKNDVHNGSIVHAGDGMLVKIKEIGSNGEMYYYAFANEVRGIKGTEPFDRYYGNIEYAYPANPDEKLWLERWIIDHTD